MTFSKEYLQKKSAILQKALNPNIILPNNEKLDSVNSNKLDIWKYKHTIDKTIILNFNIILSSQSLSLMQGDLDIILTTELNATNYPVAGEIVFKLNKNTKNISSTITLAKGIYYFKFAYTYTKNIEYNLKLSLQDLSNPPPLSIPTPIIPSLIVIPSVVSGKKYAVIIGINNYTYINDLRFCNNDAVLWCDYLTSKNYDIYLFGDGSNTYSKYIPYSTATEKNARVCIQNIAKIIQPGDQFVFIHSGHGYSQDITQGISVLCMLDENSIPQGEYVDTEMAIDLQQISDKGGSIIIFTDACFSGGFIDNIITATTDKNTCILTTCTKDGYGYDVSSYSHGAWTYFFLLKTLLSASPPSTLLSAYNSACIGYPYNNGDQPQMAGNGKLFF